MNDEQCCEACVKGRDYCPNCIDKDFIEEGTEHASKAD